MNSECIEKFAVLLLPLNELSPLEATKIDLTTFVLHTKKQNKTKQINKLFVCVLKQLQSVFKRYNWTRDEIYLIASNTSLAI